MGGSGSPIGARLPALRQRFDGLVVGQAHHPWMPLEHPKERDVGPRREVALAEEQMGERLPEPLREPLAKPPQDFRLVGVQVVGERARQQQRILGLRLEAIFAKRAQRKADK